MSRIHEALKKAEQERAGSPEDNGSLGTTEVVKVLDQVRLLKDDRSVDFQAAPVGGAPAQISLPAVEANAQFLRFADLKQRCARPTWSLDPNVNIFANSSLSEHAAEQFRTLRSRLYQAATSHPLRTLLITSSIPGEGKTFVAVNLAQAIVRQPDRRALIIDADLRCPRVHTVLGAPATPGLTNYLRGESDEIAVIQHGPEGDLCVIPGGEEVSNPSELLSNGRFGALLQRLTPVFDWIIVDSPPCLPVADASILAGLCDGVLLVVKAGSTPAALAQKACQELQARNVVGAIMNAVEGAHLYNLDYYSYQYGYGSSGSKQAGKSKE